MQLAEVPHSSSRGRRVDSKSTFVKRFGDLVALLRVDPANDAAQDLALDRGLCRRRGRAGRCRGRCRLERHPRRPDPQGPAARPTGRGDPRRGGRRARTSCWRWRGHSPTTPSSFRPAPTSRSDGGASRPAAGVPPRPRIEGAAAAGPAGQPRRAAERRTWEERRRPGRARYAGHRAPPERRPPGQRRAPSSPHRRAAPEIERLHETLGRSARSLAWDAMLGAALALVRMAPRVPARNRRTFGIQVRRAIPRRAVEALVDLAEQDAALRARAAEVLRWIGLDAAEIVLDRLAQGEAIGVREFYYDVLGGMPEALSAGDAAARQPSPPRDPARGRAARPPGSARRHRRAGATHEPPGRERASGGCAGHRRDPRGRGGRAAPAGPPSSRRPDPGRGGRSHRGLARGRAGTATGGPARDRARPERLACTRQRPRVHRDGRDEQALWRASP